MPAAGPFTAPLLQQLQLVWGDGFLSPGGPQEVRAMLEGVDLRGCEVLDLGCGVGGPGLALLREHGAARVLGADIEPRVLEQAERAALAAGLADRATYQLIAPGPLPFADAAFDAVFCKDALVSVENKRPIYAEIFRVLRPGGWYAGSDWLRKDGPPSPLMRRWLIFGTGLTGMNGLEETAGYLRAAGFEGVEVASRNAPYQEAVRGDLARMRGDLWPRLVEARGEEAARGAVEFWELMLAALEEGEFCPAHLRGRKPAK